ncbi:cobaltochelatase subunit CobN [Azospirillum sp. TSO22-1]|uniref:cobaltochelatase subunit CobN n=1 Tax=Azospirillum sp. TSO22-1 TaxID=716789 RepID=UPI000D612572|nr:cobaltochelatase subunit CobN [Azospirillum sp. TSO22-1]PWC35409.1 cobalamin biosynthesis protein CobN [Azospirillum sp. TSO22-1]
MTRLALLLAALLSLASPAWGKSVLFLSAQPIQPGKFQRVQPLAAEAGLTMEYRYVDAAGAEIRPADLTKHDLIVIDGTNGSAAAHTKAALGPLLPGVTVPWLWLQQRTTEAGGIPPETAKLLHTYYLNGGKANFAAFLCQLDRAVLGTAGPACAPPQIFPETGIYHPGYAGRVFADPAAFLAWKGVKPAERPPVVGILFHQAYLGAELTGFLDGLVARIEAGGGVAMPLYVPAMANGEVERMAHVGGERVLDVLINTQIVLNADGRKAEFERLGIPVLQAMPYRKGEQADWEQDTAGVSTTDIPFYLAQPEYAGISDPIMAAFTRKADGDVVAMDAQARTVVNKALALTRLQRLPNAEKKAAILFWNYPPGEKNLGASFLNLPRSLESTLDALNAAGYRVDTRGEEALVEDLTALLSPFYHDDELEDLLKRGLAEALPIARYRAWFDALPQGVRDAVTGRFGDPEKSAMAAEVDGERVFVVPRLKLGNVTILPQPPRGEKFDDREKAMYHDTKVPPSHFYLATYLWAREQFGADALIHYGTHGTEEWQPGKERGLSVYDYPYLVLGDTPVLYPYIVDNIGEALQTKRRGRAVTVSHATPSFAPAGLHGDINRLHDMLHSWLNMDDGEVKTKTAADLRALVVELKIDKDMGIDTAVIDRDFRAFVDSLHNHLHDLALQQQPLGLAVFGQPADADLRLFTVMQMLGRPLLNALMPDDPEEMVVTDYTKLRDTEAWRLLDRHVRNGEPYAGNPTVAELLEKGRGFWLALSGGKENEGLLAGLAGRLVPTSYGGDPIKNPDSLPTGRNLYGFDPSRVPTKQAWEAGREAAEKLIEQHRQAHGRHPEKLAFTLWSVETMRHFGMLEAQALAVMGFRPTWDAGGRITGVEAIPAAELKRPRVDAVISATGLYRDHFPNVMKMLAEAARKASELDEPGNAVAANARRIETALLGQGVPAAEAKRLAQTRVFSSESGAYGTGLDDATLASDSWGTGKDGKEDRAEGDRKLATLYLNRMQFAYGTDESKWGEKPPVNAFAEHLKGVDGALLSRSSNLYGMLTTDDPFQYLGGIGLAVRQLTGKSPELYISNLRETGNPRTETAAGFLAREMKSRYLHPGWISEMQKQGYSGTLEILDTVNNLWGWQATAPEVVRDDQWDELKAVYVDDKLNLGIKEWFEKNNPHAQAQVIERMLEAARKEYWHADPKDVAQLAQRWQELAERYDVTTDNRKFQAFVAQAAGFGLSDAAPPAEAVPAPPEPAAQPQPQAQPVQGQKLEKQEQPAEPALFPWSMPAAVLITLLAFVAGARRQSRRPSRLFVSQGL